MRVHLYVCESVCVCGVCVWCVLCGCVVCVCCVLCGCVVCVGGGCTCVGVHGMSVRVWASACMLIVQKNDAQVYQTDHLF